jgi:hypothetical protein
MTFSLHAIYVATKSDRRLSVLCGGVGGGYGGTSAKFQSQFDEYPRQWVNQVSPPRLRAHVVQPSSRRFVHVRFANAIAFLGTNHVRHFPFIRKDVCRFPLLSFPLEIGQLRLGDHRNNRVVDADHYVAAQAGISSPCSDPTVATVVQAGARPPGAIQECVQERATIRMTMSTPVESAA